MRNFYLNSRFFIVLGALGAVLLASYAVPALFEIGRLGLLVLGMLTAVDALMLFRIRAGVHALRDAPDRLSNGDENEIRIYVENRYPFSVSVTIVDELPVQFQKRDMEATLTIPSGGSRAVSYTVRPVERGEYRFGTINAFARTPLGLVRRRYRSAGDLMAPVYPSYIQMRRYELLAISNRLSQAGIKKIRRVGQTMEFDQIREYVIGDDFRNINWKATARTSELMVNQFQDEKAQQVYSVIDKGRVMKMPFEGMTLLDYAINTSLVISNIALLKGDKAGLATFSEKMGTLLPAERRRSQMQKVLEILYNQRTNFMESSFDLLYATIRRKLTTRSLLFLYTNFETLSSLERQLPYLRNIARDHLLVVVFFENTELRAMLETMPNDTEGVYLKTIAEKFAFEKRLIVKELQRYGITSILTTPSGLTVSTINKYLELKARRLI